MIQKFKNIALLLVIVLSAASCKKGWLDVTSGTEIRSDDQFSSEAGFKDALIGVYISMTDPDLYSKNATYNVIDLLAQQYATLPNLALNVDLQSYNYTSVKSVATLDAIWNKSYNSIANINNALANIDKNKALLNPISYSIIKGELLGLRAFLHFDLMRMYGYGNMAKRQDIAAKLAIPYVTQFTKELTPQLSYEKTLELLMKDLEEATVLLKEDPIYNNPKKPSTYYTEINRDGFYNNREQRMNYYAAKALQARVFQWKGDAASMSNAATAAEEVIAYSAAKLITSPSYAATDALLYPEHIFTLNVTGFTDIVNFYLDGESATAYNSLLLSSSRAQEVYETANANVGLVDVRFNTMLSSKSRGYVSNKLLQKTNATYKNNMPLIRIPEMYYIAAESYALTNPTKAVDYLNKVRKSRGIIADITSTDPNVFKEELTKEYRKELLMEGQLFFYYKRLGKTTFTGLGSTVVADDKIYVLPYPTSEIEFGNRVQ
ncbi:RagB/SusD family nutrient uptake outer membrane protein [Pedobacter sp.]|uniref:RagB/SusD family nutrient uptake outer membrane protein n=1 Tax=Pedobacter sp. TaxID=1411316 RepID=UPI003D7F94A0